MNRTRLIPLASLLIVLGAAFAGGASLLTWAGATWFNDLQGEFTTSATGADAAQALVPLALAALAALGAVLATRGWLRRGVGALIALAGVTVVWQGISGLLAAPMEALKPPNTPASEVGSPRLEFWGPAIATLGGVLLILAGIAVVLAPATKRAMGSRYERGKYERGAGTTTRGSAADAGLDADLDAVTMWKALDASQDPTDQDPAAQVATDPSRTNGPTSPQGIITDEPPSDGVANRSPDER